MANNNLKIVIEENVPFVQGLLEPYARVVYLPAEKIDSSVMADASALITRTRTACNADLLDGSKCRLIASATIGTDHIDREYCSRKGITVVNAPGCNAPAVAQYVLTSLLHTVNRPIGSYTLGIVGVGHVGSIVERWARHLGMKVMLCDPPRKQMEGGDRWCSLDEIAEKADIITFHTPLDRNGMYPTYHLADEKFFSKLKRAPIIINSSRGAVVDNEALIAARKEGKTGPVIIDCWEGEPQINRELLELAEIATPHIAGYSEEGKIRASQQALDAVTTFLMLPRVTVQKAAPAPPAQSVTRTGLLSSYDPTVDTAALKAHPEDFEELRNHYALRHEPLPGQED